MFLGSKITFMCKFSIPCDKYYLICKISPNFPKFGPLWRHCTQSFEIHQILRLPLFLGPKITFVCKFSIPCDKYYLIYTIYPNLPKFGPWWRHNSIVAPKIYIFRSSYPFFWTQRSILYKKQYFNFPNRKGYANTLKANILKMYGNIC